MAKKNCGDGYKHRNMGGPVKGYSMGGKVHTKKATAKGAPMAAPRGKTAKMVGVKG